MGESTSGSVQEADVDEPSFNPPVLTQGHGQAVVANEPVDPGGSWVPLTAILAIAAWVVAGWSSVAVKLSADKLIEDSYDISAIQIQQLNGSVTSHALVALVLALGATVPLLIALSSRVSSVLRVRR